MAHELVQQPQSSDMAIERRAQMHSVSLVLQFCRLETRLHVCGQMFHRSLVNRSECRVVYLCFPHRVANIRPEREQFCHVCFAQTFNVLHQRCSGRALLFPNGYYLSIRVSM